MKGNAKINLGISGKYKAQVLSASGSVNYETPWFSNIIVNGGLDRYFDATSFNLNSCSVGTGTTTPDATDTALESSIATSSSSSVGSIVYNTSVEPYYSEVTITYNFTLGSVVGNITEVGVNHNSGLFSRSLFLDGMGDPTSITVLADEQLRIFYKLRVNAPTGDIIGTVDGYDVTIRPADFNSVSNGWSPLNRNYTTSASTFGFQARSGAIQSITSTPSGLLGQAGSISWGSYSAGTHTRTATLVFATGTANGTIQSFLVNNPNRWQIGVSPTIAKTSDDILTIEITFSLTRV